MKINNLQINDYLYQFVNENLIAKTELKSQQFWQDFSDVVTELTPKNQALLHTRDIIQTKLDYWHHQNRGFKLDTYKKFLTEIGYIEPIPQDFIISTQNVDDEISRIAAPQLVVPVNNPRYTINAINARWGSLFDAIYGTDVIGSQEQSHQQKIHKTFALTNDFLDKAVPLKSAKYQDVVGFKLNNNQLLVELKDGSKTNLKDEEKFVGFNEGSELNTILLKNNNLHIEVQIDPNHEIGKEHSAYIKDILLESAVSTILDLEDSVATVNAQDKIDCYENLLGLIEGTLTTEVVKNNKTFQRSLNQDKHFQTTSGKNLTISGRSLMLIRNVGHHMFTDAVLLNNEETPEGILDAFITGLIAKINANLARPNGKSCYVVKPKMHGSKEVKFAVEIFTKVEACLNLKANTLKMGIMDEERRTSINLKACIHAAKDRVVFINTGFLDRTGDEIHTSMHAGLMLPKEEIKQAKWLQAYENNNVKVGLECGFSGVAQIGKGMWAMPDKMQTMLGTKIAHPEAGANCGWVPSPTAATLHATHYHQVNVLKIQKQLSNQVNTDDILTIPLLENKPNSTQIQTELDNNIQGILGYVVHWINAGVGCSKVPDINHIGLMEDRATLRISSQHVANWLHHGMCDKSQVVATLDQMIAVVNDQNQASLSFQKIAKGDFAYLATYDLIFKGATEANGYTERVLTKYRKQATA